MYLYCDIIKPVLVGNTEAQLLRRVEIPNNLTIGGQVVIKYQNPYYVPLVRSEFDRIEIDIKDDTGRSIDFPFGSTCVTLHFRKKQNNVFQSIFQLLR